MAFVDQQQLRALQRTQQLHRSPQQSHRRDTTAIHLFPSEVSLQKSSRTTNSSTAAVNSISSLMTSQSSLTSMNQLDGHGLRRRKRIRDTPHERNLCFAESNLESPRAKKRSTWLIPADHPYKIIWDLITVVVSFVGAYNAHSSIRDRSFGPTPRLLFCELWFLADIILNFVTQYRSSDGRLLRDGKSVSAHYLTTWFVIDLLSLVPWEAVYVKPIIEMQNRLNWFAKLFKRSKAVVRVTRVLRGRHLKLFGRVAKQTKHAGVNARRLLRLLVKYVPKYIFFWRRMKGVVIVRLLRMAHFIQRLLKNMSMPSSSVKRNHSGDDNDTDVTLDDWEELEEDDSFDDLY